MNDNLSLEISNFLAYACDEYYHRLNSHNWSTNVLISVQKEILYIISLCEKGFQNSNAGFITRIFLIHHKNKFQRIDGDIAINVADPNHDRLLEIPKKWAEFWAEFLKMAMELKAIFITKPGAALKKDIEHTDPKFVEWLEDGLNHYLDITNNKITNDKTKLNALKHILLK